MATYDARFDIVAKDKTARAIASARSRIEGLGHSAKNVFGGLGIGISAAALTGFSKSVIEYGSALTDAATATNTSVESLQALRFAAQEAGAGAEKMDMALVRVQKAAVDARNGLSTYTRAFDTLNINVDEFIGLPAERKLEVIARSMRSASDKQAAYAAAMDILGTRNAPKLMEVLQRLATDGFDSLAKSAKAAGQVMEEDVARKLDAAADAFARLGTRMKVAGGTVIGGLLNGFDDLANAVYRYDQAGADVILSKQSKAMREAVVSQMDLTRAQNDGSSPGYIAALQRIADRKLEIAIASQKQAKAEEEAAKVAAAQGDSSKLLTAQQQYTDLLATDADKLRMVQDEIDRLKQINSDYYASGKAGSQEYYDNLAVLQTKYTEQLRLQRSEEQKIASARSQYNDLVSQYKSIGETPVQEAKRLGEEIAALDAALKSLDPESEDWFKTAADRMRKMIDYTRIQQDEEDKLSRQREQDRQDLVRQIVSPAAAAAVPDNKGHRDWRIDRSLNPYSGGSVSAPAPPPITVPAALAANPLPIPAASSPMEQAAVDSIQSNTSKAIAVIDKVAAFLSTLVNRFEILEQQVANAR